VIILSVERAGHSPSMEILAIFITKAA